MRRRRPSCWRIIWDVLSSGAPCTPEYGRFYPRATGPEIIAAIQGAVAGLIVLSGEDMDSLLPADAESPAADFIPGEALSSRELEVLAALAEGMGNKDIASRLSISEHTVKFHVRSIMGKLRATTRGEVPWPAGCEKGWWYLMQWVGLLEKRNRRFGG